jgi:hypothetical protein
MIDILIFHPNLAQNKLKLIKIYILKFIFLKIK